MSTLSKLCYLQKPRMLQQMLRFARCKIFLENVLRNLDSVLGGRICCHFHFLLLEKIGNRRYRESTNLFVCARGSYSYLSCGYTPTSSEDVIAGWGRSLLVVYFVLPLNYLSEWSPMERRAPAQWFVTRPVSLRSLKTGTTQIPFLLVLHVFIALVYFTTVNLVHKSTRYRVVCNAFVCRALHALGRAAPTLGAPQSLGWAAPRFCWFSWVRRAHWAAA